MKKNKAIIAIVVAAATTTQVSANALYTNDLTFPLQSENKTEFNSDYYVKSTLDNISWGYLPNRSAKPILTVPSGSSITFDTVSHEGILEDQGRDPSKYFAQFGIDDNMVLDDAKAIASSDNPHDFLKDGPHIVTGPIKIDGAKAGDVLKVEVLGLEPRVPYGVVSNRHYKGALPEFPKKERLDTASAENFEDYGDVSVFCPIRQENGIWYGEIEDKGKKISFPINPFLGIMGVAPNTDEKISSVPPINVGGNLDINELGVGSTLYLPIEVDGGLFYVGDPHFAQGDGEVALTALEGSLRATVRLSVIKAGESAIPHTSKPFAQAFGETEKYWIPIGLNEDLDEAMKQSVRESVSFISNQFGIDEAKAYAYLSAGADYEVSQVVDKTKGIHALIPKVDFKDLITLSLKASDENVSVSVFDNQLYIPLKKTAEALGYTVNYDANAKTVVITKGSDKVTVQIESNIYNHNGKRIAGSASPFLTNDNTVMLPVSALSEAFGLFVNWSTNDASVTGYVS